MTRVLLVALLLSPTVALAAAPPGTRRVEADELNVRSGPSTRHRILGRLDQGTRVEEKQVRGAWARIEFKGRAGWVHRSFLAGSGVKEPKRPRSRRGFIQLPASGEGFGTYSPSSERWGVPRLIYGLERVAEGWYHPQRPRMMVGDISRQNGGRLAGHLSHRGGKDVDVLPLRRDRRAIDVSVGQSAYSRARTRTLLGLFRSELPIALILFNDRAIRGTTPWPGHSDHFHARVR
jgi:uncharacterized protein YraI